MYAPGPQGGGTSGELIGVLSVDRPRNGRRPGAWGREALQMYAFQAAIAISNARLRSNMQRALVRLEREQQALRASEESFRQAFEYAPSGMAIAEMGGETSTAASCAPTTPCADCSAGPPPRCAATPSPTWSTPRT